jgi:quinol monooxygenase YgiN
MTIFVRARFDVQPHQKPTFQQVATALRELAHGEPGVLSYEWHAGTEPGIYLAVEHFADSTAMMVHAELAKNLLNKLAESSQMVFMELYGEVSPQLRSMVEPMSESLTVFGVAPLDT